MRAVPTPMPHEPESKTRDSERTRRRILEAAFDEFTAKGFAGARVNEVAERSGVNIRALYRYYGSKEGLYEAVFGDGFSGKHSAVLEAIEKVITSPAAAERLLPALHELLAGNPAFTRLMAWDALSVDTKDPAQSVVAADVRARMYAREIELLKQAQRVNGIWAGLDPDLLLIAFMGLAIYPHVTAPLTAMISGRSSDSREFRARWDDFLERLGRIVASGMAVPAVVDRLPDGVADSNRLLRVGARALARGDLVTACGDASIRLDDNAFLVTAPVPLGLITSERGTVVPLDGPLPEGLSDEVLVHQAVYRRRSDVKAIARVLSPSVCALSAIGRTARPLNRLGLYFAPAPPLWDDHQLVADDERAARLAATLGGAPAVVMRGNGAVVVGDSLPKAVVLARCLEDASALEMSVLATGKDPVELSADNSAAGSVWSGEFIDRMWACMTQGDMESKPELVIRQASLAGRHGGLCRAPVTPSLK